MADPSWTPSLEQVADHIPTRTRSAAAAGDDSMLGTFNQQTTPTNEQATRQITAAVAEVLAAVGGTIPAAPPHLVTLASEAAALRAAADIELAYPGRQADVSVYEQLDRRAKDALQRLIDAVNDANAGPEGSLLPVYAFPGPAWYGDYPL
ncbi:hypothetical protein [Nonomuraea rhodomycinica]|uniref:Uncharacterized protein n=1 Tax=Nonomuraea rhodomycinica TaxID=1712872 RepID=A0A7Y6IWA6_9ACTN|nr:hypothetical protein [Nonomuraea rhodomycinica]NUW45547.1 hypothetical protein [Nonomuraea rhodomycinica]